MIHSGPCGAGTYSDLCYRNWELKELKSFILGSKPTDLCPGGRKGDISIRLDNEQACLLLQWGPLFLFSKAVGKSLNIHWVTGFSKRVLNEILSSFSSYSVSLIEIVQICSFICRNHSFYLYISKDFGFIKSKFSYYSKWNWYGLNLKVLCFSRKSMKDECLQNFGTRNWKKLKLF